MPTITEYKDSYSKVCDVNSFGVALGANFPKLTSNYGQESVVQDVRVFGCSLDSQRVVHYRSSEPMLCKEVLTNLPAVCRDPCGYFDRLNEPIPMQGHHRFGHARNCKEGCCDQVALTTKCCGVSVKRFETMDEVV